MCHEVTAHNVARKEFLSANPEEVVLRSGAKLSASGSHLTVDYFNEAHAIDLGDGNVTNSRQQQVSLNDATLILQYLTQCNGLPPRGKWLSFLELPQGAHHYVPFQIEACNPLGELFGRKPRELKQQLQKMGGHRLDMGDYAVMIPAFPKLPLAVVLWEGDAEFEAKAVVLFNSIAPYHLSTAALWVLGIELTKKIIDNCNLA